MSGPIRHDADTPWLRADGPESDVVMSSRVRLARNLVGFPFPNSADDDVRRETIDVAARAVNAAGVAPNTASIDLCAATPLDRQILVERHLISSQHAQGDRPRSVILSTPEEWLSIMVNEEDHLRLQAIGGGLCLSDAYTRIDDADSKLEAVVDYAFSDRFGYLTACPTNIGDGIRVSVMMHLPALKLSGEIDKVRNSAKSTNHAVRGFYGEGSQAVGDVFQVSNQTTLGKTEHEIVAYMEDVFIPSIIQYERAKREELLTPRRRAATEDRIHRALGVLRHARLLTAEEALQLLSMIRFGIGAGLIDDADSKTVNELIIHTQPAHLQRVIGREMDQSERRVQRAELVRKRLAAR